MKTVEESAGYGWYNPVGWGVAVGVVAGSSSEPVVKSSKPESETPQKSNGHHIEEENKELVLDFTNENEQELMK